MNYRFKNRYSIEIALNYFSRNHKEFHNLNVSENGDENKTKQNLKNIENVKFVFRILATEFHGKFS